MTRFGSAALALFLILCTGCHEAQDMNGSESPPPGAMSYLGYDDSGRLVVTGWLFFDIVTIQAPPIPLEFPGTWRLHALVDPAGIGPQNGSGVLAGTFLQAGGLAVELHPDRADDNVFLVGTLTVGGPAAMRYEGTWQWITLAGVRAEGKFLASQ